jgi:DNA transformation protein
MPPSAAHLDHLKDLFSPFGDITIRKMFGGAGVYCDGKIFAIADDDDVWLKVDDVSRAAFEDAALKPFEVEMNGKTGTMSYYKPPDDIYDDEDALRHWTGLALDAAARAKTPAKKKKTKKK